VIGYLGQSKLVRAQKMETRYRHCLQASEYDDCAGPYLPDDVPEVETVAANPQLNFGEHF
jgi:hypothetical protein